MANFLSVGLNVTHIFPQEKGKSLESLAPFAFIYLNYSKNSSKMEKFDLIKCWFAFFLNSRKLLTSTSLIFLAFIKAMQNQGVNNFVFNAMKRSASI